MIKGTYYILFLLLGTYKQQRIEGQVYQKTNNAILIQNEKSRCWINLSEQQVRYIQMCQYMHFVRKNGKWEVGF